MKAVHFLTAFIFRYNMIVLAGSVYTHFLFSYCPPPEAVFILSIFG
jgi:hypothetical protein